MKRKKSKKPRKKKPRIKVTDKRQSSSKESRSGITEISLEDLKAIVARAKTQKLEDDDFCKLDAAVDTLGVLTRELEAKGASVRRLRRLIFGPSTEKTSKVLGDSDKEESSDGAKQTDNKDEPISDTDDTGGPSSESGESDKETKEKSSKKRKGHGRNGADKYTGAERVKISHETLKHKDRCPECLKGKVYRQKEPSKLVRVTGVAPLEAKVYELERLRCNLCGEVFTAKAPEPKFCEQLAHLDRRGIVPVSASKVNWNKIRNASFCGSLFVF